MQEGWYRTSDSEQTALIDERCLTSRAEWAAQKVASPGQPAGEGSGPPGVMMTWQAAARAADATAFALGVRVSKLERSLGSAPSAPVCRPLLSCLPS